jgi:hypothetical protein
LSGLRDLPYSNVFLNIGEAEYKSCACEGLSNLDLVQLKSTILAINFVINITKNE